ncbi:DUF917 domain-containing protein [Methylocapsa sp. S129]|uniref:DUF917 domain-containing protein n=1 Tax=Methylocapsa sp. S129 TaxID=1641869 RepID=UPI001FEF482B|nr:DUF917 domain-containing protein [Methylocapsa sp. S129]
MSKKPTKRGTIVRAKSKKASPGAKTGGGRTRKSAISARASAKFAKTAPVKMIDVADLDDIAVGGAILGTGGGGDPYIGKLMAQQAIRKYGPVRMIDVAEIRDDDLVVPCAMMGAPTVMVEKIPQGDEILTAFRKLERFLGKKIGAILCAEAGGLNSTIPFVIGAMTGIPVIDGDGMGRAFPELQMVTFTLHGVSATPMVVVDDKGNSILLECIDNRWTERLARTATIEMGGSVLIALYPMTGAVAKKASVRGTLTLARRLGEILRESRAAHTDAIAAIQSKLNAATIFEGRVTDIARRTETGFARGDAKFVGVDDYRNHTYRIEFQNEFLIAERDGEPIVTTPDLITLLDADTGVPITTETLRFGLRIVAIAIPCAPQWRTRAGLALVGPNYFGYKVEYRPFRARA